MNIESIKILYNELKLKREKNINHLSKAAILLSFIVFICPVLALLNVNASLLLYISLFMLGCSIKLGMSFEIIDKQLLEKVDKDFFILRQMICKYKNSLLQKKDINVIQLYEYLHLYVFLVDKKNRRVIEHFGDVIFGHQGIEGELKEMFKIYNNRVVKDKWSKDNYPINCSLADIDILFFKEKDIINLLSSDKLNILDLIEYKIDYKTPIVQKHLSCTITTKNLGLIKSYIEENKDRQKNVVDFFLTIKSSKIEEHNDLLIKDILGGVVYSVFRKNNAIIFSHDLSLLEVLLIFINNNIEKLTHEAKIDFDFVKKDYEKAQDLQLVKQQECSNIFIVKLKSFVDLIVNNELDNYKKEQSKFMRYLQKAL